jgi:nondiscriminating aspartyl-tRNA synthetase
MKRIYIKDLDQHIGKHVCIKGFVQTIRDQKKIIFLVIRDITETIQCVIFNNESLLETAKKLTLESVVSIKGLVKAESQASGGYELEVQEIEILSLSAPELPIPVVVKSGEETEAPIRFDYRWLDIRKPEKTKIFKVWTAFEKGFRQYCLDNNFIQVYSPSFMGTPSESGAEVFEVQYFDRKAYLAQSPQFYKQMALAAGLEKVFISGPVFRAEQSFTTRHLTEFTGFDFEVAYIESHHDIMDIEEDILQSAFKEVKMQFPELDLPIPENHFPRITMIEAKSKLAKAGIASDEEHDLSPEEEREICKIIKDETGSDFVFITEYHASKSAFYHMRTPEGRGKRADLLYRGIEVTTLAQREHRIDILEKQALEKGMSSESLKDYLNFFRFGCPPHGGGGIGPARLIMKMLDLPNVREATYLPRDVKRLNP